MDLLTKYDELLYLVNESGQENPKEYVTDLFPSFDPKDNHNDQYLSDYIWENYVYSRSLGLSIEDAAHSANISGVLIKKMLEGVGLSLEKFVKLAEGELFRVAEMKRKHLSNLDTASNNAKGIAASITFLEKIYPKTYSPKAALTLDVDDNIKRKWEVEVVNVDAVKKEQSAPKTNE
jgi:hypothetical protein